MSASGFSDADAARVADASVDADFRPGHHDDLGAHAVGDRGESSQQAFENFKNFVTERMATGNLEDLGYALHAIQDAYSKGHGFKERPKWYQWPGHLFFDAVPFGKGDAYKATMAALNTWKQMHGDGNSCKE